MKQAIVVGSTSMDIVSRVSRIPAPGETLLSSGLVFTPGGKGGNQAVALAQLGAPVAFLGKVGNDAFGQPVMESLRGFGVNTEHMQVVDGITGIAIINVADDGQNSIVVTSGANWQVTPEFVESKRAVIREASAVLAQLEIPLETVCRLAEICEEEGVPFILDPAPARELPESLFQRVTWFTPNQTEAAFYANGNLQGRELAQSFLDRGVKNVILKLGEEGALVVTSNSADAISPFRVHAVDTTAAGDAFNGGFAAALGEGLAPAAAARFASAVAALAVSRTGAQVAMPKRAEVDALLQSQPA